MHPPTLQAEVDKDIDAIFRKAPQWEEGAEHLLLLAPAASAGGAAEPFLNRMGQLAQQSSSRALQVCCGRVVWSSGGAEQVRCAAGAWRVCMYVGGEVALQAR